VTLASGDVTFVRDTEGAPDLPALLLLHGWTATADLNFFTAYTALARSWRVVAMDHRGHGRGLRTSGHFTLEDCADDAIAVLDSLGIAQAVALGYSMGGPIALLAARRHSDRINGLVLCATSSSFSMTRRESVLFRLLGGLSAVCHAAQAEVVQRVAAALVTTRGGTRRVHDWVVDEISRHDWLAVLEAGCAIGRFCADPWIAETRMPTAVLAMLQDRVVPTSRQLKLARDIPGASLHTMRAGHGGCIAAPERFVAALSDACQSVRCRLETGAVLAAA
jgi:3-oxoadipate enol-lactonase